MLDGFRSKDSLKALARIQHEMRNLEFQILAGSAGTLLPALSVGAVGGVCDLARVAPEPLLALIKMLTQRPEFACGSASEVSSDKEFVIAALDIHQRSKIGGS
eukprot:gnl/MRDRNA2_/MRDRNA2_18784_c0_seq2.p1 gnl/MRDRNA2_/MRDRNA2_18784_c0~~gnl/MRDRNA2_/MRDRNA2_18784_c0_seq2.p1  ORF type:complete len:103 (+),score=17.66 gnl/MRDRNA2_/MRDRNA2_18784_c0_seq2:553-861(+)